MILRFPAGLIVLLCVSGLTLGQSRGEWPCRAQIQSAEPGAHFVRLPDGAVKGMADKQVLPDISDLRGKELDSIVAVEILIGLDGDVRCARLAEGSSDLAERSIEAASRWHYKKQVINGEPSMVDTQIRFRYTKDNVQVLPPDMKTMRVIEKQR